MIDLGHLTPEPGTTLFPFWCVVRRIWQTRNGRDGPFPTIALARSVWDVAVAKTCAELAKENRR